MQNIYQVRANPACGGLVGNRLGDTLFTDHEAGTPIKRPWAQPDVSIEGAWFVPADVVKFQSLEFAVKAGSLAIIETALSVVGELLPIGQRYGEYFWFNCTSTYSCVNLVKLEGYRKHIANLGEA